MTETQWDSRPLQVLPAAQPHHDWQAPRPQTIAPGWYPDPHGIVRFWDGYQWTGQVAPPQPHAQSQVNVYAAPMPQMMVTHSNKRTSHGLHLFLTIITGGVWGVVWSAMTIWHRSHKGEQTITRAY